MQLGMVGLGKMGANMTTRLQQGGHSVVAFDRSADAVAATVKESGATGAASLEEMVGKLTGSPKAVWIMVPAGKPTDETIDALCALLGNGDVIIDGGNTNYKEGLAAYDRCKAKGVSLVDAGTSGGAAVYEERA
jgi:6-phosphogluconate dehydrogenase